MDNQLESLASQLTSKAEEHGKTEALYKKQVAECEKHQTELSHLHELAQQQADKIHELENDLLAMDAAYEENKEAIDYLQSIEAEANELREELTSKTTSLTELQIKLNEKTQAYASELEILSSNLMKLSQAAKEKEKAFQVATEQAVKNARQELLLEMQAAKADAEKRLSEKQQELDSISAQLERSNQELQEKERSEHQAAMVINSLKESLGSAEARAVTATQELAQSTASAEQLRSNLGSRIKTLEEELINHKKRVSEYEEQVRSQDAKYRALTTALEQWALKQGLDVNSLTFLKTSNSSAEEINAEIMRALEQLAGLHQKNTNYESGQSGLSPIDSNAAGPANHSGSQEVQLIHENPTEGYQDQFVQPGASKRCPSEPADLSNGMEIAAGGAFSSFQVKRLDQIRRVIVRSPANVSSEPNAPSVDQEKARRREAVRPKSIMKRVTRSTSAALSLQGREDFAVQTQGAFASHPDGLALNEGEHNFPTTPKTERTVQSNSFVPSSSVSERVSKRRHPVDVGLENRDDTPRSSKQPRSEPTTKRLRRRLLTESGSGKKNVEQQQYPMRQGAQHLPGNVFNPTLSVPPPNAQKESRFAPTTSQKGGLMNAPQSLSQKPINLRTYGSQRTTSLTGASRQGESQSSLYSRPQFQSQSQPQYLLKSEDSQDSLTMSQNRLADANILLSFPNLRA